MNIVWFKKDLRINDNEALTKALSSKNVLFLYVYEDEIISSEEYAACHHSFLNECLEDLENKLDKRGAGLHIVRGRMPEVLEDLSKEHSIERILSHQETGTMLSYKRDIRVKKWCAENAVTWSEFSQTGVIRALPTRDGWAQKWLRTMNKTQFSCPQKLPKPPISITSSLLEFDAFGKSEEDKPERMLGGSDEAHRVLDDFLNSRGRYYSSEMSSPLTADESCSRISPYLSFGAISMRQVHQALELKKIQAKTLSPSQKKGWGRSYSAFQGRLRWHCHFMQKLEDEPELEWLNLNSGYDDLRTDFDEEKFQAFVEARTGYPMIDASLKFLYRTGWINFRMRAMLMSFCSYHLWLHWRRPAIHLARHFLDFEPGIHYSQAQMQSGTTGINAVRIYSPVKQALDQDPDGEFIRRELPALRDVPLEHLAQPHLMNKLEMSLANCIIGKDYPKPIVDHKEAYSHARSTMFSWKNRAEVRKQNDAIYNKHGSRR